MKNLYPIFLLLTLFIFAGCSNSNQVVSNSIIQKRKHTKSFFVDLRTFRHKKVARTDVHHVQSTTTRASGNETARQNQKISSELQRISHPIEQESYPVYSSIESPITKINAIAPSIYRVDEEASHVIGERTVFQGTEGPEENAKSDWSSAAIASFVISIIGFFIGSIPLGITAMVFGIIGVASILKSENEGAGKKGYTLGMLGIIFGAIEAAVAALFLAGFI